MLTMQVLFHFAVRILSTYYGYGVRPAICLNLTERGGGSSSSSSSVVRKLRPDTTAIYNSCTMLIGEHTEAGKLQEAATDIQEHGKLGIPAAQYGSIPGIPAYAASGSELQFMFIPRGGTRGQVCVVGDGQVNFRPTSAQHVWHRRQLYAKDCTVLSFSAVHVLHHHPRLFACAVQVQVATAGSLHDLGTVGGRLTALCAVIQCCEYVIFCSVVYEAVHTCSCLNGVCFLSLSAVSAVLQS